MNADTIRRLNEKNELSGEACRQAMDFAAGQVKENLKEFTHSFKKAYSEEGFYRPTPNVNWTTGFWTGQIWLAYEWSRDEALKEAGAIQIDSFIRESRRRRTWTITTWAFSTALPASPDTS